MKNKTIILVTVIGLLLSLTAYGIFVYFDSKDEVSNKTFESAVEKGPSGEYILKAEAENSNDTVRDVRDIYKDIHVMANSVIIADEVWGRSQITEGKINALILEIMDSSYNDKEELLAILTRWKDGNFDTAHLDHNYVWDKLGGTVGKATDVNWGKVPQWAINKQAKTKEEAKKDGN